MSCQLPVITAVACVAAGLAGAVAGERDDAIVRGPETKAAIRYVLTDADQAFLDEVEHACFRYFWQEVGTPAKLVRDRKQAPVSSIAAVGFQLSSLPIGVERGWITREEGATRAATVLKALTQRDDNKKFGVYLHYPDLNTAGPSKEGFEVLASTVDHALLLAGAITAAQYFGGELKPLVDRMIADTNWKAFAVDKEGWLSMGWAPDDSLNMAGPGHYVEHHWWAASDEERLVYFLAAGSPKAEFGVEPREYYRLKRVIRRLDEMPPFVASWPGALFTYIFSHCWIDYRSLGADDPSRFGIDAPSVDWFENSRRAVLTQRQRCIEQASRFKTFATDRWGLSACSARDGYIVPEVRPNISNNDDWCEGTVAPYAAGAAIMFAPQESLAAMRAFRALKDPNGQPLVWRDPRSGGYGFVDSFNLDQRYVCDDYVGIDHGPLLLAIENARTGLIWKLFMAHEAVQRSVTRLRLQPCASQPTGDGTNR